MKKYGNTVYDENAGNSRMQSLTRMISLEFCRDLPWKTIKGFYYNQIEVEIKSFINKSDELLLVLSIRVYKCLSYIRSLITIWFFFLNNN